LINIRKKKDLEIVIESIPNYVNPKEELEQYITPSNIVANILWDAYLRGDIEGKRVIDLGCGTGRFAIGAVLLGALTSICIDVDNEALNIAFSVSKKIGVNTIMHFILADVRGYNPIRRLHDCTVVMNPPFGIHSRGADIDFLKTALSICDTVYSIHKLSEGFIKLIDKLSSEMRFTYEIISEYNFPIRWFLPKHRRRVYYVKTVIIRFRRSM